MRRRPHRIACLLIAALLALPGAAWAQSAGDDQYSDPFGSGQDEQSEQPEPEPDAPEPSAPAPAIAAPEPTATAAAQEQQPEQLPRTGADEGLVALAGAVMLAGGIALKVRTR